MRKCYSLRCGWFTLSFVLFVTTVTQREEGWLDVAIRPAEGFLAVALNVRRRLGARFPGLLLEWR